MIKYLGSKRVLIPLITKVISSLESQGSVIDLFSGTARVGHNLKKLGYQVFANDINTYAAILSACYVQADAERWESEAKHWVGQLNGVKGVDGYFTQSFCRDSSFFQVKNGLKVDAIRERIQAESLPYELRAILLTSLMEAADRVDSTCGVQMSFLKRWSLRSYKPIHLRVPKLLPRAFSGKSYAYRADALEMIHQLSADIAYLDPPYNQHKYIGNYHIWESLVLWDKPEVYGVARKRLDVRDRLSDFNSRRKILKALQTVIDDLDVSHLVVSFNNEGHITKDEMIKLLSRRGEVIVLAQDSRRYIGAQIGIHNQKGRLVGKISHLRNTEYIFVVSAKAQAIKRQFSKLVEPI